MAEPSRLAYFVKGDDATLVADALRALLDELAGDDASGFGVEDFGGEGVDIPAVVDACQTPPFLADRRVVVLRDVNKLGADDVAAIMGYLDDPLPSTVLVLVAGEGRSSTKLNDAVKKVGHIIDAAVGRDRDKWVSAKLKEAPINLDAAASRLLAEHLGEDVSRLSSLIEVLSAAYGEGSKIGAEDLEPFLGEAGAVAPWDLTDAIDNGDTDGALTALRRLLSAGDRHPLVILATLHRHYGSMLRLDGSGAANEAEAGALLGIAKGKSTFPARKAMQQGRRLGSTGVARAVELLAQADLDLRGARAWPDELVLEVLVARLSRLKRTR
jgi:DNA polymerase III subunit delta